MIHAGFSDSNASKISSLYNKVRGKIGLGKYDLLSHLSTDNDNRNRVHLVLVYTCENIFLIILVIESLNLKSLKQ